MKESKQLSELISTVKNSSWLIGQQIYKMLLGIFVTASIARYLGPSNYGLYNYALSLATLFTAFSTLGLDTFIVNEIISGNYTEEEVMSSTFILRFISGLFIPIFAFVIYFITSDITVSGIILIVLFSFSITLRASEVIENWTQAKHKSRVSSIIRILSFTFTSLLNILIIIFNGSIIHFSIVHFLNVLFISISLFVVYSKMTGNMAKWRLNFNFISYIIKRSFVVFISSLLGTAYMQMDRVIMGYYNLSENSIGIYSAAYTISSLWLFVPAAVITSFAPILIKTRNDYKKYNLYMEKLFGFIFYICLSIALFISIFSSEIVLLIFGLDFSKSSNILTILVWSSVFSQLGSIRHLWLIIEHIEWYALFYAIIGFIINVLSNFFLIEIFGLIGAAFSAVITQFTVSIIAPLIFKKTRISFYTFIKSLNIYKLFFKWR